MQPLGLLRGSAFNDGVFKNLAGGNIYFSALKIIRREKNEITEQIIPLSTLDGYLEKQSDYIRQELEKLLKKITKTRETIDLISAPPLDPSNPLIQGILNITPDSFSDGGAFIDPEKSIAHAIHMIGAGADIIDIGGESTKPGAKPVTNELEKERVLPVIKALSEKNIPISIDSRNADVMKDAISAGANIINDVSALSHDPDSIKIAKETKVPVILMHALGTPETMQENPVYENVLLDIYDYLESRINFCIQAGIHRNRIIIDPGIGFGKTVDHNLQIISNLALFHGLGVPILVGVSRKSFIGKIIGESKTENRLAGSLAAAMVCLEQGAQIIRVHDVTQTRQAIAILQSAGRGKVTF
ncbi:MAG: dihydropteroate synthase [Kordiimonadaceae bacterium]|nr:dihydropteroate synthase [Kordiimonadaceae bacterium]